MVRAEQTGDVIGKRLGIVPTSSGLFIEALAPSFFHGKPADDPEILVVQQLIVQNFGVPGWKHSDEENFDDLRTRAELALDYLEQSDDDMLVVTHGWFMRMLMAVAMFGKGMTPDEALRCIRMFHIENTGITALGYDGTKADPWWLWVWNDHAHLG